LLSDIFFLTSGGTIGFHSRGREGDSKDHEGYFQPRSGHAAVCPFSVLRKRRKRMKVKDIMVRDVATLDLNDELTLADDIMKLGRIRHLPVVDEGRLVGIISQRDLFKASLASAMGFGEKAKREFMKTVAVKEVMVDHVITVSPEEDIKKAGRVMLEKKIGCLPVIEGDELVGLITETDILRHYVESKGR
jgi:CBS domain-containing membrane protein